MTCANEITFDFNAKTITLRCVGKPLHEGVHFSDGGAEWPNETPVHTFSPGYGPHPWECKACIADALARKEYRENNNPHRAGTKAFNKWLNDRSRTDWAMDLRGETYWSM